MIMSNALTTKPPQPSPNFPQLHPNPIKPVFISQDRYGIPRIIQHAHLPLPSHISPQAPQVCAGLPSCFPYVHLLDWLKVFVPTG